MNFKKYLINLIFVNHVCYETRLKTNKINHALKIHSALTTRWAFSITFGKTN